MSDLKILDPKSILFVGGKGFNIPKDIRSQILTPQWEEDDDRYSSPNPAPDLVVLMDQWGSHEKINRGREYATILNVPYLEAAGSKSDMVKRAEQMGFDISGIFEKKVKPVQHKVQKCKRIEGELRDLIFKKAAELKFGYPLNNTDSAQIQELVMLDMSIRVEVPQIQRAIRIGYKQGKYPPGESVREFDPPIAATPIQDATKEPPAPLTPTPMAREEFSITGSVDAIFKKLFEMHDRILSLIDERNLYAEEVATLTAENKLLKEKTERLAKFESALKTISNI